MANSIYTENIFRVLAAGNTFQYNCEIFSPGRTMKIKSIAIDIQIHNATFVQNIPWEQNIYFTYYCTLGNANNIIGKTLNDLGGDPLQNSGNIFNITRPCQLRFDSFFVSERLAVFFYGLNNHAVNEYHISNSILIEVDEKIKY